MSEQRASGWRTASVIVQIVFGLVSMTLCLPSMQDWPKIFGAEQSTVQLTFSGFVAGYGGMQLIYGPWSDRIGRKPVLLTGLSIAFVGSTLAALATSLPMLIGARVLQGCGCAASMVMGRALVHDLYAGSARTRVMALVGMTMGFIPPTATLLGGQLHVRYGWQANFVFLSALAVFMFVMALTALPAQTNALNKHGAWLRELVRGYVQLAREPAFGWYANLLAATTATFYTFLAGAPIALAHYGVTPDRLGWYIMAPPIAYIFGNLLTTRLIRTRSDYSIMMAGQWITIASIGVVLVLGFTGPHSPLSLSLPLVLVGIGHGLLVPPSLAGTVGLVPALAGSAAAVAGVMQQLGGAVGGYTVGLVPHEGQVNLAIALLAWSVLGLVCLLVLRRYLRPVPA